MTEREINDKIVDYQKKIKQSTEVIGRLKEQKDIHYRSVQDMSKSDYIKTKGAIALMAGLQNEIDAEIKSIGSYERQIDKLIGETSVDQNQVAAITKWKTQ